jgi:hypothetical protein
MDPFISTQSMGISGWTAFSGSVSTLDVPAATAGSRHPNERETARRKCQNLRSAFSAVMAIWAHDPSSCVHLLDL